MKKIEKVSIGGISFTLDADAYISLKAYLDSLHSHYEGDPDGPEITRDIEARIAELILDRQVYTKVVGKDLIDAIVAQLGSAEQIDDSDADGFGGTPAWSSVGAGGASDGAGRIGRRLYRARSPRVLGGVCGGLANYFNINVVWVRLIFLAPLILKIVFHRHFWHDGLDEFWSVSVLAYIVLWLAVPTARTARQNLEARGEKITADSIRQTLNSVAESPTAKRANSVAAEVLIVLGRIVLFFVKFVAACVAFGFLVAGLALAALFLGFVFCREWMMMGAMSETLAMVSPWATVLVLFCLAVPLLAMGVDLMRFVIGWKTGRVGRIVRVSLIVLWTVVLFAGLSFLGRHADDYRQVLRSGDGDHHSWSFGWGNREGFRYEHRNDRREQWRKEIRIIPAPTDSLPQADSLSSE